MTTDPTGQGCWECPASSEKARNPFPPSRESWSSPGGAVSTRKPLGVHQRAAFHGPTPAAFCLDAPLSLPQDIPKLSSSSSSRERALLVPLGPGGTSAWLEERLRGGPEGWGGGGRMGMPEAGGAGAGAGTEEALLGVSSSVRSMSVPWLLGWLFPGQVDGKDRSQAPSCSNQGSKCWPDPVALLPGHTRKPAGKGRQGHSSCSSWMLQQHLLRPCGVPHGYLHPSSLLQKSPGQEFPQIPSLSGRVRPVSSPLMACPSMTLL